MGKVLRSLIIRTGVDLSGAQKDFNRLSRELRTAGRNMTQLGGTLTRSITVPVLGATAAAVKFGMDFETSVAKVETIADTGVKSIGILKEEVLDLSDATGIAGTEINEALYQTISATGDTKNAMELVDVAVRSAKGGFTEASMAVDGLTSVLNSYNIELTRSEEIANLFFVAQKKGKTTFGELAQSIGTVAPLAYTAGLSIESLLADIAVLTANGIDTATAVTYMRSAISAVIKPTDEAKQMAHELGVDFSVAAIQAKGFTGFLKDLQERVGGNSEKMATLFGNIRGLNAILALTSTGSMQLMDETLKEMATNTTAVNDAFDIMNDTTGTQLQISLNKLKNKGIETFDKLTPLLTGKIIPAISNLADKIGDAVEGFGEMSSGAQKFTLLGFGIVTMLGPTLLGMGKLATGFSKIAKNAGAAAKAIKGGEGFTGAASAFLGPAGRTSIAVLGITAVVGGLTIAFQELTKESREYAEASKEVRDTVKEHRIAFEKTREEFLANKQIAHELVIELFELNEKERLSGVEKLRLKDIVDRLNNSYDGLNLSIDESTGLLKQEEKAVKDLLEAKLQEIEKTAYEEEMVQLRKDQIELTDQLAETTKKLADWIGVPEEKITKQYLLMRKAQAKAKDQFEGMQFVMKSWIDDNQELINVTRLLSAATQDYSDSLDTLSTKTQTQLLEPATLAADEMQALADAFVLASFDIEGATKMTEGEFTDMVKGMSRGLQLSQETIGQLFELYGTSFDTAKEDYETYYKELEDRTDAHYNKMGGLLSDFEKDDAISVENLIKRAQEKNEALTLFGDGIETLAGKMDENGDKLVPDEILAQLSDLPLEQVDTITELANSSDEELKTWVGYWQANAAEAHNQALAELEELKPEIVTLLEETASTIEGFGGDFYDSGYAIGKSIMDGMRLGLGNKALMVAAARAAAKSAVTAMRNELEMKSPSKKGVDIGENLDFSIALGLKNKAALVMATIKDLAGNMIGGFNLTKLTPSLALSGGGSLQGLSQNINSGGNKGAGGQVVQEVHNHYHWHSAYTDPAAIAQLTRKVEQEQRKEKLRQGGK